MSNQTSTHRPAVTPLNIVISGTNFWNPGDDFVRDGVIRVLHELFPGVPLNFLFYNFNADFFPVSKFKGIGNYVSKGDLNLYRDHVDAIVIAGLSAGEEIKDLYRWVLENGLQDRVYLIGAGYENNYVAKHVSKDPEATIFKNARIIVGRTEKTPDFIKTLKTPYAHVNCPAILSVPQVKDIAHGRRIERIGFSIQLPHEQGLLNQSCDARQSRLATEVLLELSKEYAVEVVAHHKTEYFYFLEALRGTGIPVRFCSFYEELHQIYPQYDLVVTTRLHSSLFANGHGIPGIIINDTDRHTHTLDGFPHSVWVNTKEKFREEFARVQRLDLRQIASEAAAFKTALLRRYVEVLSGPFGLRNTLKPSVTTTASRSSTGGVAPDYQFNSELKEQKLVRSLVKPGMTVFDVGAHAGKYTKLFSLLVGDTGRVIAFEPTPDSAKRIAQDVVSAGLKNVSLLQNAIAERNGTVTLHQFPEEYSSWNSLGRPQMKDPRNPSQLVPLVGSVDVNAISLDTFCRDSGIDRIDYLKLDVEGVEIRALQGASALLERKAIGFLQFEISRKMLEGANTSARAVFDYLAARGYECHSITEDGRIGALATDSSEFYENYIAVPAVTQTRSDKSLPVHFFTIVLNGRPFIEHHIEVFQRLPFDWHWHIIEGVAELKHDTAWSKANGGRITPELHRNGLSTDGTSEYLNELAARFPNNISIHRKSEGAFWDGKLEMVNAPLATLREECLLWQVDSDELWTADQLIAGRELFLAHPDKTAAFYYCHYFVGERLVVSSRNTYGNNTGYEWIRTWRFTPGCRWITHEPPRLGRPDSKGRLIDLATLKPFRHPETEAAGLVFQHFAYATPQQVEFKEVYYGYKGALEQWQKMQSELRLPLRLGDHLKWVRDEAKADSVTTLGIDPIARKDAAGQWRFKMEESASTAPVTTTEFQRVLFVRPDSIGDAVLASSMLPHLRAKYPKARLGVVCQDHVAELYAASPFVDTIICFDRKRAMTDDAYRKTIISEIAAFDPDLALNSLYSTDPLAELLTLSHRARYSIGLAGDLSNITAADRDHAHKLYTKLVPSAGPNKTELEQHHRFLAGLGLQAPELRPQVWTTPEDEAVAEAFFAQHKLDPATTIAVFPGSKHGCKEYPHFARVLGSITGHRFLFLGGAEVEEKAQQLASELRATSINLAGKTSLREMAALLRRCRLLVGSDSAGAHMACAVGTPNVVALGGGHFGRFFPYSPLTSVACLPLECFGCNWSCKYSRPHCTKDVAPEVVATALRDALSMRSSKPRLYLQASSLWQPDARVPRWATPLNFLNRSSLEVIEVSSGRQTVKSTAVDQQGGDIPDAAKPHLAEAEQHFNSGRLAEAAVALSRAIDCAPHVLPLHTALANIYLQRGELAPAQASLQNAVKLSPTDPSLRATLAGVCLKLEDVEGFEAELNATLRINPEEPAAHRLLADANFRCGRHQEAAKIYFKLLKQFPNDIELLMSLGVCLFKTRAVKTAAMMFGRILELQPDHQLARENLEATRNALGNGDSKVNHSFLETERQFWNVATIEDAMFQRVFTSQAILAMSDDERRAAWKKSATDSMNDILKNLPARPDWNVLEIGCGVGRVIKPLRERCASVDGVDISAKMIEFATRYLADAPGQGRVVQNNGCDLAGFANDYYDLVYSIIVFQHIRSVSVVRSYLSEIRRVLKPDGYFRLQVYGRAPGLGRFDEEARPGVQYGFSGNGYTEDELRTLLREAGFEIEELYSRNTWIWATARPGKEVKQPVERTVSATPRNTAPSTTSSPNLTLSPYFQPPAGSTERAIQVKSTEVCGYTQSAYQALKQYEIRDFGTGLDAATAILAHILKSKLNTTWTAKHDFWPQTLVLPIRCELRNASGQSFDQARPESLDQVGLRFAPGEESRRADIERYAAQLRSGADLGRALYVTGALLGKLAPGVKVDPKAIYMMDGARRITASALAHRRSIDALLLMHEDEYATLVPANQIAALRARLASLKWFESYQSIPMLGLRGERTLRRFDLMSLPMLRDAVVMDFGCNTGQACLKAAQAGARQVIGIEGMPDTFAGAQEIAQLAGFSNVRYANIDFNDADFARQIDAVWAEPVDYAFFFSVYRTKELTQREQLFRYILSKARKGVFFEGHASAKIDTLEYYEWLFQSFGVKGKFLGYSEGELRPLLYIDLATNRQGSRRGDEAEDSPSRSVPPPHVGDNGSVGRLSASADLAISAPATAPLVTAIVSTYNNERFMEGRLRDLVAQTLGDRLEIIVVDSGSQQNESAIVKRFMEKHPNIRYIRTEEREGIYQAWNRGIHAARGKYITNANTDDRLRPDALEILASELESNPSAALVYADFFITNTENEDFHAHTRTGYSIKPDFAPDIMLDGCHMGPQPMWRRSLHDELGWFDESLFAAGDYDFWCRVATKHPMLHVQEFLGLYLHNAAGICNSNASRTVQETEQVRAKYRSQFPAPRANLPRGFYYRDAVQPGRFVNISMVTFNRLEFTKRAIPALLEHTDFPYVLTVVDNASTDGTREYLTALKQLGVIKNLVLLDENVGVAKASNLAWSQEPDAEFYLKLDNDIVIQKPGWLRRMAETLEAVPQIGMVGYSFEPRSYPTAKVDGQVIRPKPGGTLGGACVMIPKRTERALGCWCEDYGLYGEEDFDYGIRILSKGWFNAYMEDEAIGFHLPNGRAAVINDETMDAKDGLEEVVDRDYRQFKDEQRRQQVLSGKRDRYEKEYRNGERPLFVTSKFVAERNSKPTSTPVASLAAASVDASQQPLRVAVFSLDHPATACAVLRIIAPLSRTSRPCQMVWCAKLTQEGAVVDDSVVKHADVVVIQRMFPGPEHQEVLKRVFASGKPIIYELDDWFFDMPPDNIHAGYAKTRIPFIQQVIKQAHLVTVSTEELRQRMLELHANVVVLPNLANEQQWAPRPPRADGKVIIGYAGTTTHGRDLEMVEAALKRIAKKHAGRVGFVFLGCATEKLLKLPDSRLVEFQHGYGKYVETLQTEAIDIALAPLTDNPFNRCKSNIKWVEYSAAGIAGVYSDIPAYRGTVRPGETGMLAGSSAEDWFNAIDELVTNDSKRRDIATRARESVMRDHSLAAKARLWEAAYTAAARQAQSPLTADALVPSRNGRTPSVSIVIPTFNNLALTKQCLAALYQTTPATLAEIIIVDNGSTDGSVPFLEAEQHAGRVRVVFNAQNLGFARGCNQGALEARGEFVIFLNNDTQSQPSWLEAMLGAARETQAGVVGCKLLYPDGSIQHAGIEFINGVPDHRFRHAAANAPEVNQRREFDMVTGACFLMPRTLFLELGGFDEIFRNGVEDVDLCLRARAAGRKVVYEPSATVIHHEGKTQGRFNHVTENLKLFFARWKGQFDEQQRFRAPKQPRMQKSEKSLLLAAVNVLWDGSFLDLGSLSHVNRELTGALAHQPQVKVTRLGKNAVPKPLAGMKSIIECARTLRAQPPKPAQVTVRHAWPPNWERPANGAWVLIQPWEFGSLPKEWVQNVSRVDEVWVPSDYVRRVYVDSGVDARKVHVVPNGIDAELFRPDVKPMRLATKKSFKFLFVGGTILRKGPDVLLKAFLESFTAQDDVCLVIKDFGGQSVYAGQTFEAQVKAAQARPNAPEILYLNEELPPESLPGLYAACDCLVHPYRGEGFGLPVLEAMACGLPVVVTAGGSTDDFATDEFAYRIPSIRKIFGSKVSDMELLKPGWMLEPDHTALVERLKWIAAHRDEARTLGARASEYVRREWTWERAARIAAARLVLLNERPRPVAPAPGSRKPKTIALPACGKLGHLGEARERFRAGKLLPAWNATVAALKARPYHPEAFLLLAEIALAAGDSKQAKELGDRACRLAPKWKPARQFAKARHPKSAMAKLELPALPRAITDGYSKPRLSVFLITKNEERFIGQCLESVRDIATQIVVMDTGSTDWTKTIAERFGAEIATFDWCDDFSAARNAALEKVTGDWVLMLDADEELMPDQKDRLRQMMNDPSAIAWRMPLIDKGREDEGVSQVPRLFRNAPGLFYVGRIHEQIFSSVEVRRQEWGLENKFGDATLLHHGYTQEMVQSRDKIARNLRLLQLAVEELPDEPNLLMNLGLELVRDGRLNEGLEQYATAFAAMSALPKEQVTPELRESLLTQYASHLVSSKRSTEVVRVLQSPLAKLGGLTASMHWLLGLAFIEQKQFAEGAAQMRECLAKRDKPSYAPVNRNILKGGPNHCLALCLSAMKQREPANRAFEAALKEDPSARSVRFDYARFLVEGGHEVDALKWLHQLAMEEPSDLRVWQFGGQVALSRPDYLEFAGDWTGEALKQHPDQATIISQRATALMFTGDAEAASALWQRVELTPSVQAALVLCAVLAGRSGAPINQTQAVAVNQEFINWYRKLLEFNAESLVATLHQRMESLRRMVPAAARLIESAMNEVNAVPSK